MQRITLYTTINAPIQRCYDLSLSVDLHQLSADQTKERVVAGVMSGIMKKGETVTWRAKHFGVWQELTTLISETTEPTYFRDVMLKGAFKSLEHDHFFEEKDGKCLMTDHFDFESPLGVLGNIFNMLVLTKYMTTFLQHRNNMIKDFAESDKWKVILKTNN